MLDDPFANFKGKIQSAKSGITQFKVFDYAQRVQVVVERQTVLAHGVVEGALACMAERRMSDVMHQRQGFDKVNVQAKLGGDGARNLGDFNGVSQTIAKMIGVAPSEDLRLSFQPAK